MEMIKVFITEDESIVREGLRDIVPWEKYGFEFVGDAPDGEIALPLIRKLKPDVLITDIKMPFMDGLALSSIVSRELPEAARETLLVLDGTTGQNGLIQAKQFKEIAGVTSIALTKLDGTAKGGIVIAVADALQIPVKYVGVGEQADDLMPFEAKDFVEALI